VELKMNNNSIVEYRNLMDKINYYNNKYYNENQSIIDDRTYDALVKRAQNLKEEIAGDLLNENDINDIVGSPINKNSQFDKIKHSVPVLSLDNTYNEEDIKTFLNRMKKEIPEIDGYIIEEKLDGLTLMLKYTNGILVQAITRGDGHIGEDVTINAREIDDIPKYLPDPINMWVRGEVYLEKDQLEKLNQIRIQEQKPIFKNTRNAASGSLKLLNPEEVKNRNLRFKAFWTDLIENEDGTNWHSSLMKILSKYDFKTADYKYFDIDEETEENVINFWKYHNDKNNRNINYDIDGLVIKVNNINLQNKLGNTQKVPRWSMALKFNQERVITKIKDVSFQIGTLGTITPVAELEPVDIDGSTISRVTLHNFDFIKELDLKINSMISIEKSGGVIPKVVENIGGENLINIEGPTECPICKSEVAKLDSDKVAYTCINPNCKGKLLSNYKKFVSRDAFNIENLGVKWLEKLINDNYLTYIGEIFNLEFKSLINYEGMGETMANKIINNINKSKNIEFDKFLYSLSIPMVGNFVSKESAKKFNSFEEFEKNYKELIYIDGIGSEIIKSIETYFNNIDKNRFPYHLEDYGITINYKKEDIGNKLENKKFVITGSLPIKRNELKKDIELNGGKVSGSLSKNTDYLICGENAGSKLKKAEDLNVNIISYDDYIKLKEEIK
jgi:DNA ligase (NAD+)